MKSEGRCGIQISGSGAVLYDKKTTGTNKNVGLATHTFTVFELPLELVSYFQDPPHGDGVRLTLEVQTRCPDFDSKAVLVNAFGAIEVEPAYEYYTRIQWPDNSGTNLSEVSTVIRFDPYVHGSSSGSTTEKAFTYDTHGTTLRRR